MLRLFQDNLMFGEATSSHFFRVTISAQQLLFRRSYVFSAAAFFKSSLCRTVTSSQPLFFQNSYFFSAISKEEVLFRSSCFCTTSAFSEKKKLQKSFFLEKANFLEKRYFALLTLSGELPFYRGFFFKKPYFH